MSWYKTGNPCPIPEDPKMKQQSIALWFALGMAVLAPALSTAAPDKTFVQDTKTYLSRLEKLGFAGVVIMSENGKPLIAQGYGLADRERGLPWTPATVSTIGSITKQFTAAGIARLEEKGRLGFQDPLKKYFPNAPDDKAAITIHQLLTHSSGLTDPEGIGDFDPVGRDEYIRAVFATPLASKPGERYEYANANYSLLGAVIELATGKSYEQAMRELIFAPAGLAHTGYKGPDWAKLSIAQGYEGEKKWGTILERPMALDGPYWALRANGGIHSTGEDMVRWAEALSAGSVISPKTRDTLWTPYVDESNGDSASFYGYGWSIVDFPPGVRVITHNGGNGIFFADLAIVPSRKLVVFMQTNVFADFPLASDMLLQIGGRLFAGQPYPPVPDVAVVDRAKLQDWAGGYRLTGGDLLDVTVDGNALRVIPRGWTAYGYIHSRPDQDAAVLEALNRETDRIVGAFTGGDFAPLYEAYGGAVPADELRAKYTERRRRWEEELGPMKGYEVLGTGNGPENLLTLVRFRHERGDVTRAYVWQRGPQGRLLGMMMRDADPASRFYPLGGDRFESWDPATGVSIEARIETSPDGTRRLVLKRGDGEVAATRTD
jgi:CubicO group peptidase (beta-lactamase class C family)